MYGSVLSTLSSSPEGRRPLPPPFPTRRYSFGPLLPAPDASTSLDERCCLPFDPQTERAASPGRLSFDGDTDLARLEVLFSRYDLRPKVRLP